jgi:transposase
LEFTTDETTATLCRALRAAFDSCGGVPAEVLFWQQGVVCESPPG